jgi:putative ABC transport system permease protein
VNGEKDHIAMRLLRTFCPPQLLEEIEGDLSERFQRDASKHGSRVAGRRLWWSALRFFRPGILLRHRSGPLIHTNMVQSHFKIAFRSFARQKAFTVLNIAGLTIGMAACLLIVQYVRYERSFDTFHSRAKDIYRMQYNGWANGKLNFESAVAVPAAGRAIKDNFAEVEEFTRLFPTGGVMSYQRPDGERISFYEQKMMLADSALFKVFSFHLTKGDPNTALNGVNKTVISESAARRYFGDEDPLGKTMMYNDREAFQVTGIIQDVPENSHIKFQFLVSYATLNRWSKNNSETSWGWYDFYTFVLLKPGTDVQQLQAKWDDVLLGIRKEEWEKSDEREEFILRPLTDIHLYSNLLYEAQPAQQRDGDSVYALSLIAVFILVIAWVNYINLSTARSFSRANEVGVRKVMGAFRSQLVTQFLTESFLLNVLAGVLALGLVRLLWAPFSELTGWHIPLDFMSSWSFWQLSLLLLAGGTILAGFYPALVMSSFRPILVLKGRIIRSSAGDLLRLSLVVFQFVASVFLIIGSVIVFQQVDFMKNNDLGFTLDKTLVLKGPGVIDSLYTRKLESFRTEILRIPGVRSLTASSNIPGDELYWTMAVRRLTGNNRSGSTESHLGIDYDFVPSYEIKLAAGRAFDRDFPGDENRVVINRAMSDLLDFKSPEAALGEKLRDGGDTVEIIGVLENFHQMSLKSKVAPIVFRLRESTRYYSVKMETDNAREVITSLEGPWKQFFPGNPFDYFYLDQFFNKQYEQDDRFSTVFTVFTGLAIFTAMLGLFGLASFMAVQRTKEIGIRKVMGSSASDIVLLLSRSFLRPVFVANLVAWPLAWWLMDRWLQSFPYRITINPVVFIVSGLVITLIAFLSVGSQTLKAAMTKPAETLKYE